VSDTPQHGMSIGQLLLSFIGGAKRKNAVIVGCLVQNSLKEKDDFLGGHRYIPVDLDATGRRNMDVHEKSQKS